MIGVPITSDAHWHSLRLLNVGASEVPALFGCHPSLSYFTLWQIKAGRIAEPEISGPRLKWGQRLEAVIADAFHEEGHCVERPLRCGYVQHPRIRGMGCTPDFVLMSERAILECKNVDWLVKRRQWGDEPPMRVLLQLQAQLACAGFGHGYVAALVGGNDLVVWKYEARPKVIAKIEDSVTRFWDSIDAGEEPPVDGHQSTLQAVKELAAPTIGDNSAIEISSPEFADLCAEIVDIKSVITSHEKERREKEAKLIAMLRGAQRGYGLGWSAGLISVAGTEDRPAAPGEIIKGRKGSVRLQVREYGFD